MAGRSRVLLVAAGVAAGAAGTLLLTGGGGSRADAQPPAAAAKPAEAGRYQVSAWGTSQFVPGSPVQVVHGAYIVDSQTGDVYSTTNAEKPKRVGSVGGKD